MQQFDESKVQELPDFKFLDYIDSPESLAAFLNDLINNDKEFVHALGIVGREAGMTVLSQRSGITRESLYKALHCRSKPEFRTILHVIRAFGLKLQVVPQEKE